MKIEICELINLLKFLSDGIGGSPLTFIIVVMIKHKKCNNWIVSNDESNDAYDSVTRIP